MDELKKEFGELFYKENGWLGMWRWINRNFVPKKKVTFPIIVSVEGGGVVDVDNIPIGIVIEVRDFDDETDVPKHRSFKYEEGFKDRGGNWYSKKTFKKEKK